jgi:hypothetical protein
MNVLILTPDAVGSTLLQRMLTIYMQFHNFDRPVINLHELTNGLEKYHSPEFNQPIINKKFVKNWGYYQTLKEVVELLDSVNHYKTSRLAHYHIVNRGDTVNDQIPFYNYLNENFYVIACRRKNVFEHALSMTLNAVTKKLNVYSPYEKLDTFFEMYQSGIELDHSAFVNRLNAYKEYLAWSDRYFNVSSYFNYEQDVPNIEKFILNLPVFAGHTEKITWEQNFGISFNTWNKLHYLRSDISQLSLSSETPMEQMLLDNQIIDDAFIQSGSLNQQALNNVSNLPATLTEAKKQFALNVIKQQGIVPFLSNENRELFEKLGKNYSVATKMINQMIDLGIIVSGPPIKKQTLSEKKKIIKNFDSLVDVYNNWATHNLNICSPISNNDVDSEIAVESQFWKQIDSALLISSS